MSTEQSMLRFTLLELGSACRAILADVPDISWRNTPMVNTDNPVPLLWIEFDFHGSDRELDETRPIYALYYTPERRYFHLKYREAGDPEWHSLKHGLSSPSAAKYWLLDNGFN